MAIPIRMFPENHASESSHDADWHPADIKAALAKAGWSLRQLGFHHGYRGDSSLGEVFRRPWPRVERLIADALGVPPEQIWPSRYGPDGQPNRRRGRTPMRPAATPEADKANLSKDDESGDRRRHRPDAQEGRRRRRC